MKLICVTRAAIVRSLRARGCGGRIWKGPACRKRISAPQICGRRCYAVQTWTACRPPRPIWYPRMRRAPNWRERISGTRICRMPTWTVRNSRLPFSAAKMTGVNLTGAQAKGTIFLEADMSRADLRGASFPGAILRDTKLDGARVEGADFRGALGLEAWQVCATSGWQGAQFDADVKSAVLQSCGAAQGRNQQ